MTHSATGRVIFALLASLAVHGIIIALWPMTEQTQLPKPGGHTITISLLVQADKPSARQNTPADKKAVDKITETRSVQVQTEQLPRPEPVRNPIPVNHITLAKPAPDIPSKVISQASVISIDKKDAGPATTPSDSATRNSNQLERVLRKAFNAHFYYPQLAIRRGWQGEVRLGLRIEANGNLTRVRIMQSSGHSLLDKAAMKSLNKVEVLSTAIALLNGRSLDLILPVKYRLL